MAYSIGGHGCDIRKDGDMLMACEVVALLEQRDALLVLARGALAALEQPATFPADVDVARKWLRKALEGDHD